MFRSIIEDIRKSFQSGNMITRLIIINLSVYLLFALMEAFTPAGSLFFERFRSFFILPGDPLKLLFKPWTLVTHLFVHSGIFHVGWNMLFLFWFGRITGDLLGDRRILPLYFAGGFAGAFAYMLSYQLIPSMGSQAMGASAAVMAIVAAAGAIAPDYIIRLLLIGDVKLKFVVLFVIMIDIIGAAGQTNSGGHIAHLGGAVLGFFFIRQLQQGLDFLHPLEKLINKTSDFLLGRTPQRTSRSPLKVEYKASVGQNRASGQSKTDLSFQEKLDTILDKIKSDGYESLTDEEKEFLFQASKK